MPSQLKVFVFLALTIASRNVIGKEYTVLPTEIATAACTSAPVTSVHECSTLLHYLENSSNYFSSGSVFSLQPGLHSLHGHSADNGAFVIKDIHNLTLRGPSDGKAVVNCSGSAGLAFSNISGLTLESITIEGCSMNITHSFLAQQSMEHLTTSLLGSSTSLRAGLFLSLIWNLTLSKVHVQYCEGYGMVAVSMVGEALYSTVNFHSNNLQALHDPQCKSGLLQHCKGGNLLLIFSDFKSDCPELLPKYTLNVYNSSFKLGVDLGSVFPINEKLDATGYLGGAGVGVVMTQTTYGVEVTIKECTLAENAAYIGANLYMTIFEHVLHSSIVIKQSKLMNGNNIASYTTEVDASLTAGDYTLAPGFFFAYGQQANIPYYQTRCTSNQSNHNLTFTIQNCDISQNKATITSPGVIYMWQRTPVEIPIKLVVENCCIHDNIGSSTFFALEFSNSQISPPFHFLLINTSFYNNANRVGASNIQLLAQQMISVYTLRHFHIFNCSFFNNTGSAIKATSSTVILSGMNQFIDNEAPIGAGLHLQEGSTVNLEPGSVTIFRNNRALYFGGAIYAVTNSYNCFYQVRTNFPVEYPQLVFENNTAGRAGDAVYGAVDGCYQVEHYISYGEADTLFASISSILDYSPEYESPISYAAYRLCFCGDDTNITSRSFLPISLPASCQNNAPVYIVYPGQSFTVPIAALGYSGHYGHGFTPNTVYTLSNVSNLIENDQFIQQLTHGCSNLTYSLYSIPQDVRLSLVPKNGKSFYATNINVTILPCPIGFQISMTPPKRCECHKILKRRRITCDIDTQTIRRTRNLWVGISDYVTPQAVTVGRCPFTYCNRDHLLMTINYTDEQCMPHRSGILCGSCQQGYSVAIGSSKCLQCSNYYLFFLILFAIFGVLLILFISVINLTTATGMINALLFYANIIKIIDLPKYVYGEYIFLDTFSIFINWLNLDFGIETCLYDGLNGYVKTWLQYIFPLYLFFLLFLLTILSNRSTKISKVLPSNIIAVFATILLISYTKLLRNFQSLLPYVQLSTSNGSYLVWKYDGNIPYFGTNHALLTIFSLLIIFFGFILPYTILLLIHPFLHKMAANENTCTEKLISWIRLKLFQLKPIFDAYEAPFMSSHRYWTGLLLVLRIVVLVTLSGDVASASQTTTSSAVIAMSCALLFMVLLLHIYTSKLVRALECAHYINLATLEFIGLVLQLSGSSTDARAVVLTVSIGFSIAISMLSAFIQVFQKLVARYPENFNQWSARLHKKLQWTNKKRNSSDLQELLIANSSGDKRVTHSSISRPIYDNDEVSQT